MSWWTISTTLQSLEQAIHICFQMLSPNISPVTSCIVDSPSSSRSPTLVDNRLNPQEFSSRDAEAAPPIPSHVTPNGFSSSSSIPFSPLSAGSNTVENSTAGNGTRGREMLIQREANFSQSLPILSSVVLTTITSDEVFDHLLDGSKGAVDVDGLVHAARGSFYQIEMWYAERSTPGHPAVVSIIKETRGAAKDYLEAIKSSVKVAEHGITFAADAVSLCERLSWHSGTDIQLFIDEMRNVACLAHDDAKNTFEAFSAVRHTLLQIMHRIPSQIAQIEEKLNPIRSRSIETDVSFLYCASWGRNKSHKRDHKVRQRIAAMDSLRRKASDIGKLDECLGKALNWWSQTQIMLSSMESQAVLSDDLRLSTIRIDMARRSWEAVRRDYMEYKTSIGTLMDFYPIDKMQASSRWYQRISRR